jgi:predicted O-linked N-acetylglucosamine transferase (SPINDLY family)
MSAEQVDRALELIRAGRVVDADVLAGSIDWTALPSRAENFLLRGALSALRGRYADAAAAFRAGLDAVSEDARLHFALAQVAGAQMADAHAAGGNSADGEAMMASLRRALILAPATAPALSRLAAVARSSGERRFLARAALALVPTDRAARLAAVEAKLDQSAPAARQDVVRSAICLAPELPRAAAAMGSAPDVDDPAVRARWLARSLWIDPNEPLTLLLAQAVFRAAGWRARAELVNLAARLAVPANPHALRTFIVSQVAVDAKGARAWLVRGQRLDSDPALWAELVAFAEHARGCVESTTARYFQALALDPSAAQLWNNFATLLVETNRLGEAAHLFRRALRIDPGMVGAFSNLVYATFQDETKTMADTLALAASWYRPYGAHVGTLRPRHRRTAEPDRLLRIGYVSAELKRHSAITCFGPWILDFDRSRFEVVCYNNSLDQDDISARLRHAATLWRDVASTTDDDLFEIIVRDGIDILVDFTGHSKNNRLGVFCRKPAPVQVTLNGWGIDAIEYILSDPIIIPASMAKIYNMEVIYLEADGRSLALNGYQPLDPMPDVVPLPALAEGRVTFGCLNRLQKVSQGTVEVWAEILRKLPTARLLIKSSELDHASGRRSTEDRFGALGVSSDRLLLLGRTSLYEHARACNLVDVALDPFPFGGGSTTAEALWMGVPSVTLLGDKTPGRQAASSMIALGLADFVASSRESHVATALRVASDLDRLAQLRGGMRELMVRSGMSDGRVWASAVEDAYRRIWRRWCAQSASDRSSAL